MKDGVVLLPSNAVRVTEKTEFADVANLEEADLSPQTAATGEHGLSELSPQEQAIDACNQTLTIGAPPTPDSSHPLLSAYAIEVAPATPRPIQSSSGIAVFESYKPPQQQIVPCSFKLAMNGDEAIGGALKERQQARKEYKQALDAGKMVYLLEQAAPDGKFLKDVAKI